MSKKYTIPQTSVFAVLPLKMIADSISDTDIPVGGGDTDEFDAKGGISWEDDDDDLPPVHFGQ